MEHFTDFHAHILPGVDHGCKNDEECIEQLRIAVKYGIKTIAATPHFYPHLHNVEDFIAARDGAFDRMKVSFDEYGIEVIPAAEVQLCIGLDKLPGLDKLCVENTKTILVEIPDMPMSCDMYDTLKRISRKYNVVISHVDRYSKDVVRKLISENYMLQLNAESMTVLFEKKRISDILESGLVYAVGSDLHGKDKRPYVAMVKAKRRFFQYFETINQRMNKLLGR